ncbi:MAG: ribosome biogenesis GTPase YlqF [Oscillospiraceae bacterium]|jgi:ribosome biogenesis GTPase A|nr:ribosome biogenesis GTPase YlqF [Oscillospiraceae bacterium]
MTQNTANINWFPGHMAKSCRLIKENLSTVDGVLELLDARIPISSKSPEIEKLIANKPRIILLNKSDLADENITKQFAKILNNKLKSVVIPINSTKNNVTERLLGPIKSVLAEKIQRNKMRGMPGKTLKLMIVGIPNVGKSTLINHCVGSRKTQVENRPGVTKSKQWVKLNTEIELLDTPGILWPRFENKTTGIRLALVGSIKDNILDVSNLAIELLETLKVRYPALLTQRFNLKLDISNLPSTKILQEIGIKRKILTQNGEIDLEKTACILLNEFRIGRIGLISLDYPECNFCQIHKFNSN